jgi:DNA-binding transcriptional MerR regulator
MAKHLVTLTEIAEQTRVPVGTLRYWRHIGEGPKTFRLGRRVMAYAEDVDSWIEDQATL